MVTPGGDEEDDLGGSGGREDGCDYRYVREVPGLSIQFIHSFINVKGFEEGTQVHAYMRNENQSARRG